MPKEWVPIESILKSLIHKNIFQVGYVDDKTDQRNGKESSWHGMAGRQTLTDYLWHRKFDNGGAHGFWFMFGCKKIVSGSDRSWDLM